MNKSLLIFTAPPAAGKTHLIESLIVKLNQIPLVIAPLRALANECLIKWGASCIVMTPEEWLSKGKSNRVVIFDEFHLFFYWGDSFRPRMWEAFYDLVENAELVIFLTATLTKEMVSEIKFYTSHFDSIHWVDHGNQKLKNKPYRYYKAPSSQWITNKILLDAHRPGVKLIFCPYRSQVFEWEKRLKDRGHRVWSCVGGEAALFSLKVQSERPPEFIISTTVLSHGVNLPNIATIYFLYEINNLDFWVQMVARGGRRGEKYEVYALENPHGINWNRFLNYLAILRLNLKMGMQQILKQIEEWFLKA